MTHPTGDAHMSDARGQRFEPGVGQKFWGFLLGYDIFISYSRWDAFGYALRLARLLSKKGFICYLDQLDTEPDEAVPLTVDMAIRRSTSLVLIGTPGALASTNVAHEIDVFLEKPRNVIAISVDGSLEENAAWGERIPGLPKASESAASVTRGRPSREVLGRIFNSARFRRRNQQLKRRFWMLLAAMALTLTLVGGASAYMLFDAKYQVELADAASIVSAKDFEIANERRTEAEALTAAAVRDRQRAEKDATDAQVAADKATTARKDAEALAEQARALEAEARARAAEAREQQLAAERQKRLAAAERLAADSRRLSHDRPQHGLLLAVESLGQTRSDEPRASAAEQSLREALAGSGGRVLTGDSFFPASEILYSPDGGRLLVEIHRGFAVYDRSAKASPTRVLAPDLERNPVTWANLDRCSDPAFSPDGNWVAAKCRGSETRLVWDVRSGGETVLPAAPSKLARPHDVLHNALARWLVSQQVIEPTGPRALIAKLSGRAAAPDVAATWDDREQNDKALSVRRRARAVHSGDWRWVVLFDEDSASIHDLKGGRPEAPVKTVEGRSEFVGFSPDGRWLATLRTSDERVQLWELPALRKDSVPVTLPEGTDEVVAPQPADFDDLCTVPTGAESGTPEEIEFDPDGRWLVMLDSVSGARLFDLSGRTPARPYLLRGFKAGPSPSAGRRFYFSPDGRWLRANKVNEAEELFELHGVNSAAEPAEPFGRRGDIRSTWFSPDGKWLAADTEAGVGLLRRVDDLKSEGTPRPFDLRSEDGPLWVRGFSPDGAWLITTAGGAIQLWDLRQSNPSGRPRVMRGQEREITEFAYSPDGRQIATIDAGKLVRLWDMNNLQTAAQPRSFEADGEQARSEFSPDGRWLFVSPHGGAARLWNLSDEDATARPLELPEATDGGTQNIPPYPLFSSDSRWLLVHGDDGAACLWDLSSGTPAQTGFRVEASKKAAAFSPDARHLVAACSDGVTCVWDLPARKGTAARLKLRELGKSDTVFVFSPHSRWLVTLNEGGSRLWDLRRRGEGQGRAIANGAHARAIFSDDERWLVTADDDMTRLWDTAEESEPLRPLSEKRLGRRRPTSLTGRRPPLSPAFSADSRWMFDSNPEEVWLWDLRSVPSARRPTKLNGGTSKTNGAPRFSPDGRLLAVADGDEKGALFNLNGRNPRRLPLAGHRGLLRHFNFSPDGRWLTAMTPGELTLWPVIVVWDTRDVGLQGKSLGGAKVSSSAALTAAFSPDGRWLVTGASNGLSNAWNLSLARPFERAAVRDLADVTFSDKPFSPDSRWLVGWGLSEGLKSLGTRLWRLEHGQIVTPPVAIENGQPFIDVTADSHFLFAETSKGVVTWSLRLEELTALARRTAGRTLSDDERGESLQGGSRFDAAAAPPGGPANGPPRRVRGDRRRAPALQSRPKRRK